MHKLNMIMMMMMIILRKCDNKDSRITHWTTIGSLCTAWPGLDEINGYSRDTESFLVRSRGIPHIPWETNCFWMLLPHQ